MEKDLISVIVPVYNVEKYIKRCIDSIINQKYTNLEIILVDDGSPDNCGKICDEYAKKDNRIKVIHKENGGVSSARNAGLEVANGKYITFVDADDWVEHQYIEQLARVMIEKQADYVTCGYNRVYANQNEKINYSGRIIEYTPKEYLVKLLNVQLGYGFCHMKLIKRNVIKDKRFYDKLIVGEDAFFNVELCENMKKITILEKTLYNYRFNENSIVRTYDEDYAKKYKNSMEVMYEYIIKKYGNDKEIIQNLYNYIAYHILLISVNYCFNPKNKNKIKSLKNLYNIKIFKDAIKFSNYKMLSFSRKVALFSLKHKLSYLTGFICYFRQLQFKLKK